MRPPALPLLLALNLGMGCATYVVLALGQQRWTASGWSAGEIGLAVAAAMAAYAVAVAAGGRLAERAGRARTAIIGCAVALAGAGFPLADGGPWAPAIGFVVVNFGCALFFPANAGLFSDAEGAAGSGAIPLHRKVSRYNLGWSGGNLAGFAIALGIAGIALHTGAGERWGFAVPVAILAAMIAVLWPWRALPPLPPPPAGDRAPHPALPGLTLIGRGALLLACLFGMAVLALGQQALAGLGEGAGVAARSLWLGYAVGYVGMFVLFGAWTGWILRPWRLLALQLALPAAAAGYLAVGLGWLPQHAATVGLIGVVQGIGYGAVYTGSIYYSLRLPDGASRAAGLHETALGVGSVIGPLAAGALLPLLGGGMAGLGWWGLAVSALVIGLQLAAIPRLPR